MILSHGDHTRPLSLQSQRCFVEICVVLTKPIKTLSVQKKSQELIAPLSAVAPVAWERKKKHQLRYSEEKELRSDHSVQKWKPGELKQ